MVVAQCCDAPASDGILSSITSFHHALILPWISWLIHSVIKHFNLREATTQPLFPRIKYNNPKEHCCLVPVVFRNSLAHIGTSILSVPPTIFVNRTCRVINCFEWTNLFNFVVPLNVVILELFFLSFVVVNQLVWQTMRSSCA